MDLFEYAREKSQEREAPLASRLRPATLEEVVGQQHIIGKDKLLYRAIKADKLSSVIFYGPPGTGKTTLAKVIANTTSAEFTQINATVAGKKDMEAVVEKAKETLGMYGRKTILFVDEIHRFNKGQQDYLLPFVEDGTIILIGATTENPYFEVNGALLSRSVIFELYPLSKEDVKELILRAVYDREKGDGRLRRRDRRGGSGIPGGPGRRGCKECPERSGTGGSDHRARRRTGRSISLWMWLRNVSRSGWCAMTRAGISIMIPFPRLSRACGGQTRTRQFTIWRKCSMPGRISSSSPGRIMICASEDVGNADPQALTVAVSAAQAVERVGMPEAQIILSQAVLYVATAPKSNSAVNAISAAMENVRNYKTTVPAHLQDAHYQGAKNLGRGTGYKYAHDYPHHYVEQQYLPDEILGDRFYEPGDNGKEKEIQAWMEFLKGE